MDDSPYTVSHRGALSYLAVGRPAYLPIFTVFIVKVCIALAAHYSMTEQAFVCEEPDKTLNRLFSTFSRPQPFNTVLDVVMTPTVALFSLLTSYL